MANNVLEIITLSSSDEETTPKISLNAKGDFRSRIVSNTSSSVQKKTFGATNVIPLPYHQLSGNSGNQRSYQFKKNHPNIESQPNQYYSKSTARKSLGTPILSSTHIGVTVDNKKRIINPQVQIKSPSFSLISKGTSKLNREKGISKNLLPAKSSVKVSHNSSMGPVVPVINVETEKTYPNTVGKSSNGNVSQLHSIEHSLRKSGISITLAAQRFSNASKTSTTLSSGNKSNSSCISKNSATGFHDVTVTTVNPPGHCDKNLKGTCSKALVTNSSELANKNGIFHLPSKSSTLNNKCKQNPLPKSVNCNARYVKNVSQKNVCGGSKISNFQPNLSKSVKIGKKAQNLDQVKVLHPSQEKPSLPPNSKKARLGNTLNPIILDPKESKRTFSKEKERIQSMRKSLEQLETSRVTNTCISLKETKPAESNEKLSRFMSIEKTSTAPEKLDTLNKKQCSSLGPIQTSTSPKSEEKKTKKQVTSPKLSLKRKQSEQEVTSNKKSKFDALISDSTPMKKMPSVQVSKEKVPFNILDDNKTKLKKLIQFSLPYLKQHPYYDGGEEFKIKKTLLRYLNSAEPSYAESKEFSDYLLGAYSKIIATPNDIFVHLKDVKLTLKAQGSKSKVLTVNSVQVPVEIHSVEAPETDIPKTISSTEKNQPVCDKHFVTNPVVKLSGAVPKLFELKESSLLEVSKNPEDPSIQIVHKSVECSKTDSFEIESPSLISAEDFSNYTTRNAEQDVQQLPNVISPMDIPNSTANNVEHYEKHSPSVISPVNITDSSSNNEECSVQQSPSIISSVNIPDSIANDAEPDVQQAPVVLDDIKDADATKASDAITSSSSLNLTEMEELPDKDCALKMDETIELNKKSTITDVPTRSPLFSSSPASSNKIDKISNLSKIINKIGTIISPKVTETQQLISSLTFSPNAAFKEACTSAPNCDGRPILSPVSKNCVDMPILSPVSKNAEPVLKAFEQPASASPIMIVSVSSIRENSPEVSILQEVHPWDSPGDPSNDIPFRVDNAPKKLLSVFSLSSESNNPFQDKQLEVASPGPCNTNVSLPGPSNTNVSLPGPSNTNVSLPGPSNTNVSLPGPSNTNVSLPGPSNTNVSLPGPSNTNVSLPGPSNTNVSLPGPSNMNVSLPRPSIANAALPGPSNANVTMSGLSSVGLPSKAASSLGKQSFKSNSDLIQDEREKKIIKLEEFLAKLDKKIKDFNKRELSLEDLDNDTSVYLREEQYKRKFVQVWNKICSLKKCSPHFGRSTQKKFSFSGSRYDEVNNAVERFINKRKPDDRFPNYSEVLNVIQKVEDEHQLAILSVEALAREVFTEIGRELKRRREKDLYRDIGCYLTDDVDPEEDPAYKDPELEAKLQKNQKEGERKIDEVINKFAEDAHENLEESNNEDDAGDECETSQVADIAADGLSETDPTDNSPDEEALPAAKVPSKIIKEDVSSNASTEPKDDEPHDPFIPVGIADVDELSSTSTEPGPSKDDSRILSITEDIVVQDESSNASTEPGPDKLSTAHRHSSDLPQTVLSHSSKDERPCTVSLLDDSCSSSSADLPSLSELISTAQK